MKDDIMTKPSPLSTNSVSLGRLLWVWLLLGGQSFGGGAATLALIRRAVVERYRWVSEEEFTHDWALCQVAPGINLLALTILIGKRVAGPGGIVVSLLGLLLPSVAITILITAFYKEIKDLSVVQAALRGVIPASVGLGLLTAWQMARAPLETSRQEGKASLVLATGLLVASGLVVLLWKPPIALVLLVVGGLGAITKWIHARRMPGETA